MTQPEYDFLTKVFQLALCIAALYGAWCVISDLFSITKPSKQKLMSGLLLPSDYPTRLTDARKLARGMDDIDRLQQAIQDSARFQAELRRMEPSNPETVKSLKVVQAASADHVGLLTSAWLALVEDAKQAARTLSPNKKV